VNVILALMKDATTKTKKLPKKCASTNTKRFARKMTQARVEVSRNPTKTRTKWRSRMLCLWSRRPYTKESWWSS